MATKMSKYTGGNGRKQLPSPYVAHVDYVEIVEHVFTEALASADILELFYLPPDCRITDISVVTAGTSTATMDMGLMTGNVASDDPARTLGTLLFDDVTPTTQQNATVAALAAIAKSAEARSIGVKFSANIAASGSTKLTAIVRYAST